MFTLQMAMTSGNGGNSLNLHNEQKKTLYKGGALPMSHVLFVPSMWIIWKEAALLFPRSRHFHIFFSKSTFHCMGRRGWWHHHSFGTIAALMEKKVYITFVQAASGYTSFGGLLHSCRLATQPVHYVCNQRSLRCATKEALHNRALLCLMGVALNCCKTMFVMLHNITSR